MHIIPGIELIPFESPYRKLQYNEDGEELTDYEKQEGREESCRKSGTKYTDGHGHDGLVLYHCGIITCKKCLAHRRDNQAVKFSWMNSGDYVFKIFFTIKNITQDEIRQNRIDFAMYAEAIKNHIPPLEWFRFILTSKYMILMLRKEDIDILPGAVIPFEQLIEDYIDWTQVIDPAAKETLLTEFKNQRRILGRGDKPKQAPQACNRSVGGFSLKSVGGEIVQERDFEEYKHAEYLPIEKLKYILDTEPLSGITTPTVTFGFREFLMNRLAGYYLDEWDEYHGVLESTRMQKYLKYLAQVDSKNYGFLL